MYQFQSPLFLLKNIIIFVKHKLDLNSYILENVCRAKGNFLGTIVDLSHSCWAIRLTKPTAKVSRLVAVASLPCREKF